MCGSTWAAEARRRRMKSLSKNLYAPGAVFAEGVAGLAAGAEVNGEAEAGDFAIEEPDVVGAAAAGEPAGAALATSAADAVPESPATQPKTRAAAPAALVHGESFGRKLAAVMENFPSDGG
jgi:hypothetical protein